MNMVKTVNKITIERTKDVKIEILTKEATSTTINNPHSKVACQNKTRQQIFLAQLQHKLNDSEEHVKLTKAEMLQSDDEATELTSCSFSRSQSIMDDISPEAY